MNRSPEDLLNTIKKLERNLKACKAYGLTCQRELNDCNNQLQLVSVSKQQLQKKKNKSPKPSPKPSPKAVPSADINPYLTQQWHPPDDKEAEFDKEQAMHARLHAKPEPSPKVVAKASPKTSPKEEKTYRNPFWPPW